MKQERLIVKIQKELQKIEARYQEKYGVVFFDIKVRNINDIIILNGIVLSEKQKNEAFLTVKDIVKDVKVENKIKVLGDPTDKTEIGWGAVIFEVADIWAKFPDKKNLSGRARLNLTIESKLASQALKSDFLRVLARKNKWLLVQTRDLAIGWINKYQVSSIKYQVSDNKWVKGKRAKKNEILRIRLAKNIQNKFHGFLNKYLNAQYLLGGMTEKGIDCSGLTERFYLEIFNLMLPRHSGDQALIGEKIELKDAHFGDLIFLRNKTTKQTHIGAVVEKFEKAKTKRWNFDNILILNARLEKGAAVIEDLPDILKSYNLISVRRIIKQV